MVLAAASCSFLYLAHSSSLTFLLTNIFLNLSNNKALNASKSVLSAIFPSLIGIFSSNSALISLTLFSAALISADNLLMSS